MIDITDKSYKPSIDQISEYIGNSLFDEMLAYMKEEYAALHSVDYSGDNALLGWNVRFNKAGRTLCRVYPKPGFFTVLVVVGRKEKERFEALLPEMSSAMRELYGGTKEGMGQRWLVTDVGAAGELYNDILALVRVRRQSK